MTDNIVSQIHIEAARNSTDDFNLFHDKNRWDWVQGNPFNGPIALGFQLGCFVEDQVNQWRQWNQQFELAKSFRYSHFELNFAGIVKAEDRLSIQIKATRESNNEGQESISNRILVKASDRAALLGSKKESHQFMFDVPDDLPSANELKQCEDKSFVGAQKYFVKRKYMIVGNAKNFLTSAFAQQADYIDEFADKVEFPQMYPLSLISSALLERAQRLKQDLVAQPMIYATHKLSIDKSQVSKLRSNDQLHILIGPGVEANERLSHLCIGIANDDAPLFIGKLELVALSSLIESKHE